MHYTDVAAQMNMHDSNKIKISMDRLVKKGILKKQNLYVYSLWQILSPDACILAVGGIKQVPVVKNGQVVPGNVMKVTLSCDHRVVDGASGAAFLNTIKSFLEQPVLMFV